MEQTYTFISRWSTYVSNEQKNEENKKKKKRTTQPSTMCVCNTRTVLYDSMDGMVLNEFNWASKDKMNQMLFTIFLSKWHYLVVKTIFPNIYTINYQLNMVSCYFHSFLGKIEMNFDLRGKCINIFYREMVSFCYCMQHIRFDWITWTMNIVNIKQNVPARYQSFIYYYKKEVNTHTCTLCFLNSLLIDKYSKRNEIRMKHENILFSLLLTIYNTVLFFFSFILFVCVCVYIYIFFSIFLSFLHWLCAANA